MSRDFDWKVKSLIQYLEIGKIVNIHGIKGELKVMPLTDKMERFLQLKWVFAGKGSSIRKYDVEGVKFFKNWVFLKLKGIDDANAAEKMRDYILSVDRQNAVKLPENSFFICDIIGCAVLKQDGRKIGEVKDVLKTGSNDVYVVDCGEGREILVPALKSVVTDISIEEKRMVVSLPEGLVEYEI